MLKLFVQRGRELIVIGLAAKVKTDCPFCGEAMISPRKGAECWACPAKVTQVMKIDNGGGKRPSIVAHSPSPRLFAMPHPERQYMLWWLMKGTRTELKKVVQATKLAELSKVGTHNGA